jgi:hypothetical protein
MQCQAGWLTAALERWQDLHEDLHATTQVLARLASRSPCWSGGGAAESCRGYVNVPGKDLARVSQTSPARVSPGTWSSNLHKDLHATSLHKDLHATTHAPLGLGLDIVDGVRALNLKGGVLVSASQVVPARILPGPREPPRQGSCRGSSLSSAPWLLAWTPSSLSCILPLAIPVKPCHGRGYNCPCTSKGY